MDTLLRCLKNLALALGIVILLPLTVYYGVQVIKPHPSWEFATQAPARDDFKEHDEWRRARDSYDKEYKEAYDSYTKEKLHVYNWTYFCIAAIIGLVCIVAGVFMNIDFLGLGFIFGGLITLVTAFFHSWGLFNDIIKFFSLLGAIGLLIALAYILLHREKSGGFLNR